MGYDGYRIEGALDGFKEDLIEQLPDSDLPRWVESDRQVDRLLEGAQQRAEKQAERRKDSREYERPPTGIISFEVEERFLPSEIYTHCQEWVDDSRGEIEVQSRAKQIYFSHFDLTASVTVDGEIYDVYISAQFKNH